MTITADQLADALHTALWCGTFGEAIRKHLQSTLDAYDAQEGTGGQLAAIIRDDPEYAAISFSQLAATDQRRHWRAYVAWLQLHGMAGRAEENTAHDASIIVECHNGL